MTAEPNRLDGAEVINHDLDSDEVQRFMDKSSEPLPKVPDDIDLNFILNELDFSDTIDGLANPEKESTKTALEESSAAPTKLDAPSPLHVKAATAPDSPTPSVNKTTRKDKGNRASKNRLQSEFGWQLGLQAAKVQTPRVIPEAKETVKESKEDEKEEKVNDTLPNAEDAPKAGDVVEEPPIATFQEKPADEAVAVDDHKPPVAYRKDKSDTASTTSSKMSRNLASKEFGWQRALQENVGSITLKSASTQNLSPDGPQANGHVGARFGDASKGLSQLSLHTPSPQKPTIDTKSVFGDLFASGKRGENGGSQEASGLEVNGDAPSPKKDVQKRECIIPDLLLLPNEEVIRNHPTLREQLQMPVRGDFGWQVGLASKSLTFPLSKPSSWPQIPERLNPSEFGLYTEASATAISLLSLQGPSRDSAGAAEPSEAVCRTRLPLGPGEFACQLCFANTPLHNSQGADGCAHQFCLSCFQHHVRQNLSEEVYPIKCPACGPDGTVGLVTEATLWAANLGQDIGRLRILELRSRPVQIECPVCRVADEVSWVSFNNRTWSSCTTCSHRWCKACHKDIPRGDGTFHLCIQLGAKEPKKKRKQARKQARFCPGCGVRVEIGTTTQKSNEVTCPGPGCQLHFCYSCGGVIADGTSSSDIPAAVAHHNRTNPACVESLRKHDCTIQ